MQLLDDAHVPPDTPARSNLPSPSKSSTATGEPIGWPPPLAPAEVCANVPSPFPMKTRVAQHGTRLPFGPKQELESAISKSRFESRSRSAIPAIHAARQKPPHFANARGT